MAEAQVVRLMLKQGWSLTFHRLKTRVAEIDLIFEKRDCILLVEVKTLNDRWRATQRLTQKQLDKLRLNRSVLSHFLKTKKIDAVVAWVERNNVITFCKID